MSKYSDAYFETIEARLTVLERLVRLNDRLSAPEVPVGALPQLVPHEGVYLNTDRPDVLIFPAHTLERDLEGRSFRWIAANPTIQFLLPRIASESYDCQLELQPHAAVADSGQLEVSIGPTGDRVQFRNGFAQGEGLAFTVPADTIPWISITLHGLAAVRPSTLGEGTDDRLLTARFYGIQVSRISRQS